MNDLVYNNIYPAVRRRPRVYRRRPDMLMDTYTDNEIRERYRFNRPNVEYICDLLHDDLARETNRNHALSVSTIVQAGLRFFATNSFQQVIGDVVGIHRSTCCKVVHEFSEAVCRHRAEFISLPRNDNDRDLIKKGFYEMGGMPGVIGLIDCTHAKIQCPSENEADYVNRKGVHSINVQCVTDHLQRYIDVEARWPGSTHDSFILNNSRAKDFFENTLTSTDKGIILGDSGYPIKKWLMTPYHAPNTPSQHEYNRVLPSN